MKGFLQRNQSLFVAIGTTVALTLWLLSETGATGSARDPSLEAPRVDRPAVTRVRVKTRESQRVMREVIIYGKTEAARSVTLRAEIGDPSTQWWTQLATAVAGGLSFATLLILVLTPSLQVLGERLKFGRRNTARAALPEATSTL